MIIVDKTNLLTIEQQKHTAATDVNIRHLMEQVAEAFAPLRRVADEQRAKNQEHELVSAIVTFGDPEYCHPVCLATERNPSYPDPYHTELAAQCSASSAQRVVTMYVCHDLHE